MDFNFQVSISVGTGIEINTSDFTLASPDMDVQQSDVYVHHMKSPDTRAGV